VGKGAEGALGFLGAPGAGAKRGAEEPLVATECALDLPALSVADSCVPALHLASVWRGGPLASAVGVAPDGNDGGWDAELLAAEAVIVLGVVALVAQQLGDLPRSGGRVAYAAILSRS
jgi:hypothetical protein